MMAIVTGLFIYFHHLKVDYEAGQKWTLKAFDFEELKRLFHTWGKEMSAETYISTVKTNVDTITNALK